jgi:hypothetical protein
MILLQRSFPVFIGFFLLAFLSVQSAKAFETDLRRIVFEGNDRSGTLNIINNTEKTQTYSLEWRHYVMDADHGLQPVADNATPGAVRWADDMVRFAPRRITIPAGGTQKIHLLLRQPSALTEGEYRSHLRLAVEDMHEPGKQTAVIVPVIVRLGEPAAGEISISNIDVLRKNDVVTASFSLTGQSKTSLYGDLDFVCESDKNQAVLHHVPGIAFYPEITARNLKYNFDLGKKDQACSAIKIVYRTDTGKIQSSAAAIKQ